MPNEINGTPIQSASAWTDTTLGDGDVWTSPELGNLNGGYYGGVFADQDGTLTIEVSDDGTNWADFGSPVSVSASTWTSFSTTPGAALTKVVYTNGATPQTVFRLYIYASLTYERAN